MKIPNEKLTNWMSTKGWERIPQTHRTISTDALSIASVSHAAHLLEDAKPAALIIVASPQAIADMRGWGQGWWEDSADVRITGHLTCYKPLPSNWEKDFECDVYSSLLLPSYGLCCIGAVDGDLVASRVDVSP